MTASQIQSILYFPKKTPVKHWFYIAQGSQENFASRKKKFKGCDLCESWWKVDEEWVYLLHKAENSLFNLENLKLLRLN